MLNRYTIASTIIVFAALMIVASKHTLNAYTVAFSVAAFTWIGYQVFLIARAHIRAFNAGLEQIAAGMERHASLLERPRATGNLRLVGGVEAERWVRKAPLN